ncbi:hypothetical protein BD560DRAFT_493005 [Blakeslea trispora]|nr:hypothetical protein BD560DRAFT_493005 [Blakeslea trispora]
MTTIDIPDEYMHCFNVMDEIPRYDPMEIEYPVGNIVEAINLEWHYWENGEPAEKKKKQEPSLKKLLNLADYETARKEENKKQQTENSEPNESSIESGSKAQVRGPYRSYALEQIQELLDLVIEQGLSARNFGRSKKGMPVKAVVPFKQRSYSYDHWRAICEKGVVELHAS